MLENNRIFMVLLMSLFIFTQPAHAEKRILKWIDSKGVVHYGDQLPPTAAGNSNQEMNKQGITIKRNVIAVNSEEDEKLKEEKLEQKRKDNVLLASYTTVEEIDLARNRNLNLEKTTLQALKIQKDTIDERLKRNIANAKNFQAKNKPVPDYLKEEIKIAKTETGTIIKKMADHERNLAKINRHYDAEVTRFIALKENQQQK
jgi:uncharacterized protein DUF4124